ncbi:MAG: hypothetical protein JNN07_05930 [Verrucomicrobiales bacterium]|nr:hypothetical protein [Verrucomicrobiales bacterium]
MLKRILTAVGVLVAGFAVVVGLVYLELRAIVAIIELESSERIPLYREALEIKSQVDEIGHLVAESFLALRVSDVQAAQRELDTQLSKLDSSLSQLNSERFKRFHSEALAPSTSGSSSSAAPPPEGGSVDTRPNSGGIASASVAATEDVKSTEIRTMGQLISLLSTNAVRFRQAGVKSAQLAESRLVNRGELESSKEALAKTFRKVLDAYPLDPKSFNVMTRGVLAVLHTTSIRDLNFVGRAKFTEGLEALRKSKDSEATKPLLDEMEAQFTKTFDKASQALAAKADYEFFAHLAQEITQNVARLRTATERQFDAGQILLAEKSKRTVQISLIVSIITVIAGTLIAFLIARATTRQICLVTARVKAGTQRVNQASSAMQGSSSRLSDGAHLQASAVEETASATATIADLSRQNSLNAATAKAVTASACEVVDLGSRDMDRMQAAMSDIQTSSSDVGKILKTIDEIAFQTNILALNAAVEAARAGDAGLGFAVVANEVRNLAQRSAAAAAETSEKIAHSCTCSRQGVQITREMTERLQVIVKKVKEVDDLVAQIAKASSDQDVGINQIKEGIQQIEKIAIQNSQGAEQTTASASGLSKQAEVLKQAMTELDKLVGSSASQPADETPGATGSSPEGGQPSHPIHKERRRSAAPVSPNKLSF